MQIGLTLPMGRRDSRSWSCEGRACRRGGGARVRGRGGCCDARPRSGRRPRRLCWSVVVGSHDGGPLRRPRSLPGVRDTQLALKAPSSTRTET